MEPPHSPTVRAAKGLKSSPSSSDKKEDFGCVNALGKVEAAGAGARARGRGGGAAGSTSAACRQDKNTCG